MPRPAERTLPEFARPSDTSSSGSSGVRAATRPDATLPEPARPEPARRESVRQRPANDVCSEPGKRIAANAKVMAPNVEVLPSTPARAASTPARATAPARPAQAAASPAQPASAEPDAHVSDLARRARRALEAQHYDEAFQLLMRALRSSPNDATCKALRGYLLHLRGDRGEMPEHLIDEALDHDPLCERAHHYKGLLALARRDLDQAAHHFSEAVVLDPSNTQAAHLYRRCRDEQKGIRGVFNAVLRAGERVGVPLAKLGPKR